LTTATATTPTPNQLESLELWIDHGCARLEDTAWSQVNLDDTSSWPSEEEIAAGDFHFTRSEVERLLEAQQWLADQHVKAN